MATKAKPQSKGKASKDDATGAANPSLMDSAQQIWLAGLGAFAKAQSEGTRVFENLVKDGLTLEAKTRKTVTNKVEHARDTVVQAAAQVRERTQDAWNKIEEAIESRVQHTLHRLGVPAREELNALHKRIEQLTQELRAVGAAAKKSGTSRASAEHARRPRDDFGDLVKDIEDAQLAAKKSVLRNAANDAPAVTETSKKAAKQAPGKIGKKSPGKKK